MELRFEYLGTHMLIEYWLIEFRVLRRKSQKVMTDRGFIGGKTAQLEYVEVMALSRESTRLLPNSM